MTKICSNCKTSNPDNSAFCQNCGKKLNETTHTMNYSDNNKSSKKGMSGWWNQQGTGVKVGIGVASVCCIGLILIIVIGGMLAPDNTVATNSTPTSTTTNTQANAAQPATSSPIVKVIATGPWTGNILDSSGSRSVQGTGSQTFQIQTPGIVSVTFQKDNSNDAISDSGAIIPDTSTLTVQIIDGNGNVVATQSTSADAGVVSTSYTF